VNYQYKYTVNGCEKWHKDVKRNDSQSESLQEKEEAGVMLSGLHHMHFKQHI